MSLALRLDAQPERLVALRSGDFSPKILAESGTNNKYLYRMGLKGPLVYGELGALFGEIRRRVERNEDGSLFE